LLKLLNDERGSILPLFAAVVVIFTMLASVVVDYARYAVVSEKLKTAAESASTAAAMSAKRYVKLKIDPGSELSVCCDQYSCWSCCVDCGASFTVQGREDELVDSGGYRSYCCSCGCGSVEIKDRWVEYEDNGSDSAAAAAMFFALNKPREMSEAEGGESYISSLDVRGSRSADPLYPSVIVRTGGKIKTLMMDFFDEVNPGGDFSEMNLSRCSQGGSYYYDLNGKWHRSARSADGCE
jgi:hypothetical protein